MSYFGSTARSSSRTHPNGIPTWCPSPHYPRRWFPVRINWLGLTLRFSFKHSIFSLLRRFVFPLRYVRRWRPAHSSLPVGYSATRCCIFCTLSASRFVPPCFLFFSFLESPLLTRLERVLLLLLLTHKRRPCPLLVMCAFCGSDTPHSGNRTVLHPLHLVHSSSLSLGIVGFAIVRPL